MVCLSLLCQPLFGNRLPQPVFIAPLQLCVHVAVFPVGAGGLEQRPRFGDGHKPGNRLTPPQDRISRPVIDFVQDKPQMAAQPIGMDVLDG